MSETNPVTGRPYGGRDEKPDDEQQLPGEQPMPEDEVAAPESRDRDDETASRAPDEGTMTSADPQRVRPSPGVPDPVDAPDPADATDADPPGGSAANQRGRVPDE